MKFTNAKKAPWVNVNIPTEYCSSTQNVSAVQDTAVMTIDYLCQFPTAAFVTTAKEFIVRALTPADGERLALLASCDLHECGCECRWCLLLPVLDQPALHHNQKHECRYLTHLNSLNPDNTSPPSHTPCHPTHSLLR